MLLSFALIMLVGLISGGAFKKLRLPALIGMLITGIVLGPNMLNLIDSSVLGMSAELRRIALIIILLKAGLSLDIGDLKKIGRPALLMSFVPALFEIGAVVVIAPPVLGVSYTDAFIIGSVLAAVSPAVVVPKMVELMEKRRGTDKCIPQLILAGSSLDDVFVIVVFTAALSLSGGGAFSPLTFIKIPVSIILGIVVGAVIGFAFSLVFAHLHMRDSAKVILLLGAAFLLVCAEDKFGAAVPFSGLLAVMSMAVSVKARLSDTAVRVGEKFSRLWVGAEVVLFVLVGAAVNIDYAFKAGAAAVVLIILCLAVRSVGVFISVSGCGFSFKEKLFCILSYIPKATVQAAIGSVPLSMGLACGETVLSVAVISIILTAPLGAVAIDAAGKKCLKTGNGD